MASRLLLLRGILHSRLIPAARLPLTGGSGNGNGNGANGLSIGLVEVDHACSLIHHHGCRVLFGGGRSNQKFGKEKNGSGSSGKKKRGSWFYSDEYIFGVNTFAFGMLVLTIPMQSKWPERIAVLKHKLAMTIAERKIYEELSEDGPSRRM